MAAKIGGETFVGFDADAGFVAEDILNQANPIVRGEETLFLDVVPHADEDVVEEPQGAAHDIFMSGGEGVERTGKEGFFFHNRVGETWHKDKHFVPLRRLSETTKVLHKPEKRGRRALRGSL